MSSGVSPFDCGNRGGGGGKRDRDDDEDERRRRGPDKKPTPIDKVFVSTLGVEGPMRALVMILMNLGVMASTTPSAKLLTKGGVPKSSQERRDIVGIWMQKTSSTPNGVMQRAFSELAQAFVHVLRAVHNSRDPDTLRILVGILTEKLTEDAVKRHEAADDDSE